MKIRITIEGDAASGKTILAHEIEKYLDGLGVEFKARHDVRPDGGTSCDMIDIYERVGDRILSC